MGITKTVYIHALVWGLIVLLPYFFFPEPFKNQTDTWINHLWYPVAQFAIIFYLNYLLLIDRLFLRKRHTLFIGINILIVCVLRYEWVFYHFMFPDNVIEKSLHHKHDLAGIDHKSNPLSFVHEVLTCFVPAVAAVGVKTVQYRIREESRGREIENKNLEAELQSLKYQLQPHFVLNVLNNIYSLIDSSPTTARDNVHKLGKLMRYLLYGANKERVALAEETDFIDKYVKLMQTKGNDKLTVDYRFPEFKENYSVAPLLFLPLVENAFKHGVSAECPSNISFEIRLSGGNVTFKSSNTNHPKTSTDRSGSGIGLENLKKRLELLYPSRHEFNYGISENNRFTACLKINLETDEEYRLPDSGR